jgi:Na+-driven multidrug efflux pump
MPSFWRQGVLSLATMAINYNARIYGDAAVAAIAICTKVFQMINSVIIGFGHGFQPVLGFNYGAKRWDRVKEAVVFSVKICFTILFCASVVGFFLAPHIVTLFRDDPDVISIGTRVFRFQCLVMPTFSVAVFSNMFFQALGKSWRATVLAIARPGFLIPMSFLLTRVFGLTGLELAQPVADALSFLVGSAIMIHYFKCEFGKE